MSYFGATGTPVLDFWVSKPEWFCLIRFSRRFSYKKASQIQKAISNLPLFVAKVIASNQSEWLLHSGSSGKLS